MADETSWGVIIAIFILYIIIFIIIGLIIAVYFKEIPVNFGPTGPIGPIGHTGPTGPRNIGVEPPSTSDISIMHWNPHWQCTTHSCCANVAMNYINTNLVSRHVDFANVIELEDKNYKPPNGYVAIKANCGDQTTLIYNSQKWQPIGNHNVFCINDAGTVGSSGRPTIVQKFQSKTSNFSLYVIGSHYTHFRDNYIKGLNQAFTSLNITSADTIVFMADTNQNGTSEKLMIDMLQGTPPIIMSSPVKGTCCYSGPNSKFHLPYDRIITTFGTRMSSDFPTFQDIIATPIAGCSYDEMHLPVFSIIHY